MASQLPILDFQADSIRLVLGSPPQFYRIPLDSAGPEETAAGIRSFLRLHKLTFRRCGLILSRQACTDPEHFRATLRKAGCSPLFALPREDAYGALLDDQASACLVVPEDGRFQAVFLHRGKLQMGRAVDSAAALTQILQIYRFSHPEVPVDRVFLPQTMDWNLPKDFTCLPLESLLPEGIPAEGAAAYGWLCHPGIPDGVIPLKAKPNSRKIRSAVLCALAALLFLYCGVVTPILEQNRAKDDLTRQQILAVQLDTRLEGYEALADAYLRTGGSILTESEQAMHSPTALLEMVAQLVFPNANVTEFTLSGGTLTLHLTDISLQDAGSLVSELKSHSLVSQAQLHSAESGENSNIFLRITLEESVQEGES